MILGNSGGKNKGKKYIKLKGDEVATAENQLKADKFNKWFGTTYTRLQTELITKNTYDQDVLNDTFLRIYDKICFGGLNIADYKAYFHRAFFTNFMQKNIQNKRYTDSLETINDTLQETIKEDEYIENSEDRFILFDQVVAFVKEKYPQYYEIFKLNIIEGLTYKEITQKNNIEYRIVETNISKIKKEIKNTFLNNNNPSTKINIMETKTKFCSKCKEAKNVTAFNKNSTCKDGLQAYCKLCQSIANKEILNKETAKIGKRDKVATVNNDVLASFTSLELMKELHKRGYNGELTFTSRVNLSSI